MWVLYELTANQKNCRRFKVLSFILHKNNEPFLDQIMTCNEKCILYDNRPAQWLDWDDQLNGWTEKKLQSTSQSQTCIRKRSWSLFGGRLTIWPATVFESQWNYYIWEVCSANQCDAPKTEMPAASTGQQKGPNSSPWQHLAPRHTTNASKVERIGLQSFASFAIFTWSLTNLLPLLQASQQLFAGKMLPQKAENTFHEFVKSQSMDFYTAGINKLISCLQKCVACNGSYFDY